MYEFTEDMAEISGFGGGYEQTCRHMLKAGLEWLDEHPESEPRFKGWKNIDGVIFEDNEDAKELSKAVVAVHRDCTGAMHQAVIETILFVRQHSWQEYVEAMVERKERKGDDDAD